MEHNQTIKLIHAHVQITIDMMLKLMLAYQLITVLILINGMVSDADALTISSHGLTDVEHAPITLKLVKIKLHACVIVTGNSMVQITDV